jgi:hypothetical protein
MGEYADSLKKKKVVPPQAAKAQASETKQQAAVEKKYNAPTKNKGEYSQSLKDQALKDAQSIAVRDAHDKPITSQQPPPYTPPPKTGITKNGGPLGTADSSDLGDSISEAMPPTPEPIFTIMPVPVVKTPTRNVTNISDLVPQYDAEYISQILFENLSAVELSIRERHDTIEGINQRYSIVSNLSEIRKRYEITKQLTVMDKFRPLTKIFTIDIESKIPQEDYIELEGLDSTYKYIDENNIIIEREKGYYYIDTNGDLVIELVNLERSQEVEIQIATSGTIYKIEKVES